MFPLLLGLAVLSTMQVFAFPGRIVNGTDAEAGEIPYIVSLRYYSIHRCGASILNEYWILTAAHCVYETFSFDLSVQYGVTNISFDDFNAIPVQKYIFHESYTGGNAYLFDVAVVKLAEPLKYSEFVQPITLPPAFNATPEGATAILSGWGAPFNGGFIVLHLQRVDIQVYTDDDCEYLHSQTGPTDRHYHVCAGVVGGGKGQCNGDSGGPLVVNGTQVGIVSWSVKPCTVAPYPGVFTKVSSYVHWIYENIAEGAESPRL